MIAEAKNLEALRFDDGGARRVGSFGLIGKVLTAIEFNDKLRGMTNEVGDVVLDWHLPKKNSAVEPMTAELRPKDSLDVGRVLAQRPRIRAQSVGDLPVGMFRIDH